MTFTPPTPNPPKPKIIYNKSDGTIETVGPIPVHDFDFGWDSDQSTEDFASAFLSPTKVTEFDFSFSTLLTKVDFVVQEYPTAPDQRIQEIKDYYGNKNLLTIPLKDVKDNTPVYDIEPYSEGDRFDTGLYAEGVVYQYSDTHQNMRPLGLSFIRRLSFEPGGQPYMFNGTDKFIGITT